MVSKEMYSTIKMCNYYILVLFNLALTDIHWDKQSLFQKKYILRFVDNGGGYIISASDQSVTASQVYIYSIFYSTIL